MNCQIQSNVKWHEMKTKKSHLATYCFGGGKGGGCAFMGLPRIPWYWFFITIKITITIAAVPYWCLLWVPVSIYWYQLKKMFYYVTRNQLTFAKNIPMFILSKQINSIMLHMMNSYLPINREVTICLTHICLTNQVTNNTFAPCFSKKYSHNWLTK